MSASKLEKLLDTLLKASQEDPYPEYIKKEDLLVRYLLHRHLYGKDKTQEELYKNISINELRIIAIRKSVRNVPRQIKEATTGRSRKKYQSL